MHAQCVAITCIVALYLNVEDSLMYERNNKDELKEKWMDMKLLTQRQADTIRELKVDNELLKENISLLKCKSIDEFDLHVKDNFVLLVAVTHY